MQFILWFEPERVGDPKSWIATHHPEWLLPATESTVGAILNEGNPAAKTWLLNHVDALIKSQGIDWYREDMNGCGPLTAWRKQDEEDRQGITENFYVQGHLAYWDELKRRNPGLHEDSCASGGRRNDLETLRRAVPMTRSDFVVPTFNNIVEGNQGHTYGLSFWLPWYGSEDWFTDSYSSRSFYVAGFQYSDTNDYQSLPKTEIQPASREAIKKAYRECARIAPFMLGDYYPLTPYSRDLDHWLGWQFNRPEKDDGVVQAFRRKNCTAATLTVKLRGLDPRSLYALNNFDDGRDTKTGDELMKVGLSITIPDAPGAAVITYTKIHGSPVIK
jgi:alpha-galactosidase